MRPGEGALAAFGVAGEPLLLPGGFSRTAWRVGDVVVKRIGIEEEHTWLCDVYDGWSEPGLRVPQPLRTSDGGWSHGGWGAYTWIPGDSARVGDDPSWFRDVHERFHATVADLPRPAFLDTRDDAWSHGDAVAWSGRPAMGSAAAVQLLQRAIGLLRPVDLPAQVVHGDFGGNVLRDGDAAGVIDWPPYWRPVGWSLAVVATDVVCWEGVDPAVLDLWSTGPQWPQLLLRAAVFRLATRGWNEAHHDVPVGSEGQVADEERLLGLVEERL